MEHTDPEGLATSSSANQSLFNLFLHLPQLFNWFLNYLFYLGSEGRVYRVSALLLRQGRLAQTEESLPVVHVLVG